MPRPPTNTGIPEFLTNVEKSGWPDKDIVNGIYKYLVDFPETDKWSFNHEDCRFGTTHIPKTRRGKIFIAFGLTYLIIPTFHGELLEREPTITSKMKRFIKSKQFYGDDAIVLLFKNDRQFVLDNIKNIEALVSTAYRMCM